MGTPIRDVVLLSSAARKDSATARAELPSILLEALDDSLRDRHEVFAKAIDVGLASRLLFFRAHLSHRMRSRETKRRRYGNPRRIPHLNVPSLVAKAGRPILGDFMTPTM